MAEVISSKNGNHQTTFRVRLREGENLSDAELFKLCDPNFVPQFGGIVSPAYGYGKDVVQVIVYND